MSRVKNILIRAYNRVEKELLRIDQLPLWWLGLIIAAIFFLPYFILGKGCIFEINDQLDESIMNYILPARHFLDGSMYIRKCLVVSMPAGCSLLQSCSFRCIFCIHPESHFCCNILFAF